MKSVYTNCPIIENDSFLLKYVSESDCNDLLLVYSDKNSVPFFNSDNCGGDNFYYTTPQRMNEAIKYWHFEYEREGFVRWSIVEKKSKQAIGTIELFKRMADDFFTNCALLRLDLRSDFERKEEIEKILSLIVPQTYELFDCDKIATKAVPFATDRIEALKSHGFIFSSQPLIGLDGTLYSDYFVVEKDKD